MSPLPDMTNPKCYELALKAFLRDGKTQEKAEEMARWHCQRAQSRGTFENAPEGGDEAVLWHRPQGGAPGQKYRRGGSKPEGGGTNK